MCEYLDPFGFLFEIVNYKACGVFGLYLRRILGMQCMLYIVEINVSLIEIPLLVLMCEYLDPFGFYIDFHNVQHALHPQYLRRILGMQCMLYIVEINVKAKRVQVFTH
jgi:hypothetical protein